MKRTLEESQEVLPCFFYVQDILHHLVECHLDPTSTITLRSVCKFALEAIPSQIVTKNMCFFFSERFLITESEENYLYSDMKKNNPGTPHLQDSSTFALLCNCLCRDYLAILKWYQVVDKEKRSPTTLKVSIDFISQLAAMNGQLDILKCFFSSKSNLTCIYLAIGGDHAHILKWLLETWYSENIIDRMVSGGVVKFLNREIVYRNGFYDNDDDNNTPTLLYQSAREGKLKCFEYLRGKVQHPRTLVTPSLLSVVVKGGNVAILDSLVDIYGNERVKNLLNIDHSLGAIESGSLPMLQWILSKGEILNKEVLLSASVDSGHFEMVKWIYHQPPIVPLSEYDMKSAVRHHRLDIIKWMRSVDPPCPWSEEVCLMAVYHNNVELLQWLRSQDPPCPWNLRNVRDAAVHQKEILQWLDSSL